MDSDASEMEVDHYFVASPSTMDIDDNITPQKEAGTIRLLKDFFLRPNYKYMVSGLDCRHIFIWKKNGGKLIWVMEANTHVINCIEAHSYIMVLTSSGIDNDIKIWTPKAFGKVTLPKDMEQV